MTNELITVNRKANMKSFVLCVCLGDLFMNVHQ